EAMLALWVWRRTVEAPRHRPRHRIGRYIALGLWACLVPSPLVHFWAEAHYYVPVSSFARYLPLYFPLKDSRKLARLGLVDQARPRARRLAGAPAPAPR